MRTFSRHLLPLLQLTRMALVFTAIADSMGTLLLWAKARSMWTAGATWWGYLTPGRVVAVAVISVGMYGFGMSLNDIIDRRRDRQISPGRPLPSGRIGVGTAHAICALLALASLIAGFAYAWLTHGWAAGWMSIGLLVWTGLLITFYDYMGKYLVWPGLITLGLIRFFHATIPAPQLPLLWHPLLLLNHVTVLSAVAYAWEEKRPRLTRAHWLAVAGGLMLVNLTAVGTVWWRRAIHFDRPTLEALWITPGLLWPVLAAAVFALVALRVRERSPTRRQAGQTIMLYGLLWLIVYDAAFVYGYVGWIPAVALLGLLPVAYLSVQLMRWWGQLVAISQKPQFKRAGAG